MNKNEPAIKALTVVFAPTLACNLRCKHCYQAKADYAPYKMSLETLDAFVAISAPYINHIDLIWHGGEPLLMGHEFFDAAYSKFKFAEDRYGTKISCSIQTNGVLLDKRFVEIFKQSDTHISVSFDGPYNDVLRQCTKQTEDAINLLKSEGVDFSCLSVASAESVKDIESIYDYFNLNRIDFKINPVFMDGAACDHKEISITKDEWACQFIKLFDRWFFDKDCKIFCGFADVLLRYILATSYSCLNGCLFKFIAVNPYGDVFPCGRMMAPEFKIGNVHDLKDIRDVFLSDVYTKVYDNNMRRIDRCSKCKWFSRCHAGCNMNAFLDGDMQKPSQFDCHFNHIVFGHIEELLNGTIDLNAINPYVRYILEESNKQIR